MGDVKRWQWTDAGMLNDNNYRTSAGNFVEESDYETLLEDKKQISDALVEEELRFADADQERIDLRRQIHILTDEQKDVIKELETAESQLREAEKLVGRAKAFADMIIRYCLDKRPEHETMKTLEKASIGFSKSAQQFLSTLPSGEGKCECHIADKYCDLHGQE